MYHVVSRFRARIWIEDEVIALWIACLQMISLTLLRGSRKMSIEIRNLVPKLKVSMRTKMSAKLMFKVKWGREFGIQSQNTSILGQVEKVFNSTLSMGSSKTYVWQRILWVFKSNCSCRKTLIFFHIHFRKCFFLCTCSILKVRPKFCCGFYKSQLHSVWFCLESFVETHISSRNKKNNCKMTCRKFQLVMPF